MVGINLQEQPKISACLPGGFQLWSSASVQASSGVLEVPGSRADKGFSKQFRV